jgi:lipopolysaccharide export system permease protein
MILRVQRLYIIEFFQVLFILTIGMSILFGILGLSEKLAEFMKYDPSIDLLFEYGLASIPRYVLYFMPMGALLSGLFVFSLAIKRREIVAIKTSGGKMKKILSPFIAIGLLLTLFCFVLGEFVVPVTAYKVREVANEITHKGSNKTLFKEGTLYMRGKDGSIVKIALYMPEQNMSKGISIFKYKDGSMTERIDAKTAVWEGTAWRLKDIAIYSFEDGKYTVKNELVYTEIESPNIFREDVLKVEEMTIIELVRYKNRLTEAGFKNNKLSVDVSARLSYPIINLFMLLLGISLSVGGEQKGFEKIFGTKIQGAHSHAGMLSAGLGLVISVAYWLGYTFALSLGYSGAVPPIVAPWIVPVLFSLLSLYLYANIPE